MHNNSADLSHSRRQWCVCRKTGVSVNRRNKFLNNNNGKSADFQDKENQNEMTTVNEWFESSDEDDYISAGAGRAGNAAKPLKLDPSKQRKSLQIDVSLKNKIGSFSLDMDLVDSSLSTAASASVLGGLSQVSLGGAGHLTDSPSAKSNKENDDNVEDDKRFSVVRKSLGRKSSLAAAPLQDITPEYADEFSEESSVDSAVVDFKQKRLSIRPSLNNIDELAEDDLPSHVAVGYDDRALPAHQRVSEMDHHDQADYGSYDDADVYDAPEVFYDAADADHEDAVPVESKPVQRKSILKKTKQTFAPAELDGDLPKELRRPAMSLKIFQKGGSKLIETEEGLVRRSTRMPMKPLQYWRNEKVVFGRRQSGAFPVPVIHDVIRFKDEDEQALKKKKVRKVKTIPRGTEIGFVDLDRKVKEAVLMHPDSEYAFKTQNGQSKYKTAKLLADPVDHTMFSGMFMLPKGEEKPERTSGTITIMGYVVRGDLELTIQNSVGVVTKGGSFCIPKGNKYRMRNIGERDLEIFIVNNRESDSADNANEQEE